MKFKYRLPDILISRVAKMAEFASGGAQVTVKLCDGREFHQVLISNSTYIVAARGYKDLPFRINEIESVYQTAEDKNPQQTGAWDFWDDWD